MSQLMHQIIMSELQDLAQRITENIKKTDQWASGDTARKLRIRKDGDTYTLYGRDSFESLEIGYRGHVSPRKIFNWSIAKGIPFEDERDRLDFSFRTAKKIVEEGTVLFRTGKTFSGKVPDVYSSEIRQTIENLYEKLGAEVYRQIETITLNF